ncbi:MAG: DUF3857 domain-containing protein [Planctomycetota bacterium]
MMTKVPFLAAQRRPQSRFVGLGAAILFLVAAPGCHAATRTAITASTAPDLSIGAEQFPEDDAVLLRWEHHWTLRPDGSVSRREHRWVKLLNSRPIGRFADPRLDFCAGEDELKVHTAQSILPDGRTMPVPSYSFNLAGPDDVGGWSEYAAWQQQVICFSGIENDVVLELDYEVITRPGVLPWISAELRLDDEYPTVQRVVSVTVPEGTVLHHGVDHLSMGTSEPTQSAAGGMTTFSWTFANLPGSPAEPQAPPWRQRCPRLRFSTCPSAQAWVSAFVRCVDAAAQPTESIKKLAEAAVKDEADPLERVRKVAKKLHDSFNVVDSPKALRSLACRPAAEVLRSNYGNPLEAAALCAAALRALELEASVEVAVEAAAWDERVPTEAAFAGVVVAAGLPDGRTYIHPQHGIFRNPGSFGKHWLLGLTEAGALHATYLEARGERVPSEIQITGKVTIDPEGKAAGELRVRLTGAFYDPEPLQTADPQEALVKNVVARVLSDFKVTEHSVATLSDEVLRATAHVASKETLKKCGTQYLLTLGTGPAFLTEFPLPLNRSYRKTAVDLAGPVRENIDLTIELPEGWTATTVPTPLSLLQGSWGTLAQQTEIDGRTVRFRRTADLATGPIASEDFAPLREALNNLRNAQNLLLVCGK